MALIFVKIVLLVINVGVLFFVVSYLVKVVKDFKASKKAKILRDEKLAVGTARAAQLGSEAFCFAKHDLGLSFNHGDDCTVYITPDAFFIDCGEETVSVLRSAVNDIDFMTREEVVEAEEINNEKANSAVGRSVNKFLGEERVVPRVFVRSFLVLTTFDENVKGFISFDVSESVDEAAAIVRAFLTIK